MRFIALLRGVNVGGRIIKMADLKLCAEELGFQNVVTILQTGNIVLDSDLSAVETRHKLEGGIGEQFGYEAKLLIYTPDEMRALIDAYPFDRADATKHDYILFVDENIEQTLPSDPSIEQIAPGKGVIYWSVVKGHTLDSLFAKESAKALRGRTVTNRNINTLEKILSKS